jgi:hypothetical protein
VVVVEDSAGASSSSRAAFPIALGRAAISSPEGFQRSILHTLVVFATSRKLLLAKFG